MVSGGGPDGEGKGGNAVAIVVVVQEWWCGPAVVLPGVMTVWEL